MDRILESAERLVVERGFDNVTVDEIRRDAGVSNGSFYARFQDRDSLLAALQQRFLEQSKASVETAVDRGRWKGKTLEETVAGLVDVLLSQHRAKEGLWRAFVQASITDPVAREREQAVLTIAIKGVTKVLLDHRQEIAGVRPRRTIHLAIVMALGAILEWMLFPVAVERPGLRDDRDFARELSNGLVRQLRHP